MLKRANGPSARHAGTSSVGELGDGIVLRCRPPGQSGIRAHLPDLIRAQRGACGICSEPLPDELDDIHVDHIMPRVHGGTDSVDNLQATHAHCNLSKGAKLEFGA